MPWMEVMAVEIFVSLIALTVGLCGSRRVYSMLHRLSRGRFRRRLLASQLHAAHLRNVADLERERAECAAQLIRECS